MRKTEEEIMPYWICSGCNTTNEISKDRCNHCGHGREYGLIPIAFAQRESIMFAEWKDNNTKESPYVVGKFEYKNGLYTTAQLYAIYLKNKF